MKQIIIALVFSAALAGCATAPEAATETPPDSEVYTLPDTVVNG